MSAPTEPFWEAAFRADRKPFGPPSTEILELLERLPRRARVLDLGCGDGRNALPLARAGHAVTAVDRSRAALESLRRAAIRESPGTDSDRPLGIQLVHADVARVTPSGEYELIIAHGVLHLLLPEDRDGLIRRIRRHTRAGGWNVLAVFTRSIPPPDDMAHLCRGLLDDGELSRGYADWHIELDRRYVLQDEHPGGVRHRHAINKIVARCPAVPRA